MRAKLSAFIKDLQVHKDNRGKVYPSGKRCRSLCIKSVSAGFALEEYAQQLVAVQEPPAEEIRSRGEDYESGAAYNKRKSEEDEYLCTCFREPYGHGYLDLLAHNHMTCVLLAWLTRAKWDIPYDAERGITYCDAEGSLSLLPRLYSSPACAHPRATTRW